MKLMEFLYSRLKSHGVDHIFGIPGESIHLHYHYLYKSGLEPVILTHEPSVGYAADAYSRIRGLGAALVSYGVGTLNTVNAVGQAYAENSPLVVISGGPGVTERSKYLHLHHKVRSYDTHQRVMNEVTEQSLIIDNPITATSEIDRALNTALTLKRPVYIEIPRDMCEIEVNDEPHPIKEQPVDEKALSESLNEVVKLLNKAKNPVIIAGAEPARINLQKEILTLASKTNIPVASTLLGKSVFPEENALSMGVYFGQLSNPEVAEYINKSDCILLLGAILSDINLGMFTSKISLADAISSNIDGLKVKSHFYPQIGLKSFLTGLIERNDLSSHDSSFPTISIPDYPTGEDNDKVTVKSILTITNEFVDGDYRVICDVGDCLFAGQELQMKGATSFLSPAYYLSMGFAVPGAIGAQFADTARRPIVMVGDGAFQMTGNEVLTMAKHKLNPIIMLFNNTIYATLKYCEPPKTQKDHKIPTLDYSKIAEVMGGKGIVVKTVGDLKNALNTAKNVNDTFVLLDIRIDEQDISPALRTFGESLGNFVEVSAAGKLDK